MSSRASRIVSLLVLSAVVTAAVLERGQIVFPGVLDEGSEDGPTRLVIHLTN